MSSSLERDDSNDTTAITDWLTETIQNDTGSDLFLVAPTTEVLETLSRLPLDEDVSMRSVTVIIDNAMTNTLRRNYPLSSRLLDLPSAVSLLEAEAEAEDVDLPTFPIVSTDSDLVALVTFDDTIHRMTADSEEIPSDVFETYQELAPQLDDVNLNTCSRSRIYETLEEEFGTEVANDHEKLLSTLEADDGIDDADIRGDMVALLIAAKHDLPHYDIGKWAEDNNVASKATVSRRKGAFEDRGYFTTTKIRVDVGRPRQQLHLAEDVDPSIESLAEIAKDSVDWTIQN